MDVAEVTEKSSLLARLMKVSVYAALGSAVAWRTWAYNVQTVNAPYSTEPYPIVPTLMCACLIAVLYTLGVITLAGRSDLLQRPMVAEHGDGRSVPTRRPVADRATA